MIYLVISLLQLPIRSPLMHTRLTRLNDYTSRSTAMASIAASMPPELFANTLSFVGDPSRLRPHEDPRARREEMKHLSACASTCVYWAKLIRPRIFAEPVLRSAKDLHGLQSLLRCSSPSTRIDPIKRLIRCPNVFYKLGDYPWFCNLGELEAYRTREWSSVDLHVAGPVPPGFISANTQRAVLHPLFYSVPRVLPMTIKLDIHLNVENVHFPTPTLLFNLLQDCLLLHPRRMSCRNLTWDRSSIATPFSVGFTLACRQDHVVASRCTDDALVTAMMQGIPHIPHSLRSSVPQLCLTESCHLLDVMRSTYGSTEEIRLESYPHLSSVKADCCLDMIEGACCIDCLNAPCFK